MDRNNLEMMIKGYLNQALEGYPVESNNFDFKRQWYDLRSPKGKMELLKDTCAMVNTVGGDSLIVIGFDEKQKKFFDSVFEQCGLNDMNELGGIISKHVDMPFSLDCFQMSVGSHQLSVIHIPTSYDKPHVLRRYASFNKEGELKKEELQRIFTRNSTGTKIASRSEIDQMYYDRKNIVPSYKLFMKVRTNTVRAKDNDYIIVDQNVILDNAGTRPLVIEDFQMTTYSNQTELLNEADFSVNVYQIFGGKVTGRCSMKSMPIVVSPNEIVQVLLEYHSKDKCERKSQKERELQIVLEQSEAAKLPIITYASYRLILANTDDILDSQDFR